MKRMSRLSLFMSLWLFVFVPGLLGLTGTMVRAQEVSMIVVPDVAPQGSTVQIQLEGFLPNEFVSLWQTLPDYDIVYLDEVLTDAQGGLEYLVEFASTAETGVYYFNAQGRMSNRVETVAFVLVPGQRTVSSAGIQVVVYPHHKQQPCFVVRGSGYRPAEMVALWLWVPDGYGLSLGTTITNRRGTFVYNLCPEQLTVDGRYFLTAYGVSSGLTGVSGFDFTSVMMEQILD